MQLRDALNTLYRSRAKKKGKEESLTTWKHFAETFKPEWAREVEREWEQGRML